ncbi:hypothetical protein I4U23_027255 [Adineta vaga]|nr:hypothetical protein I4U23_027255 [Adineta vaga]
MVTLQLIYILLFTCDIGALTMRMGSANVTSDAEQIHDAVYNQNLKNEPSLGTAVVNTQVLTVFSYQGSQIYVYSALSNANENLLTPQKWIFYFVPIMLPAINDPTDKWVFTVKNEVRIKLMLSNADVEELAKSAIIRKYDLAISQYSKFWDVAPLMIDSLMAYIVRGTNLPVEGVHPYKAVHPNQLTMEFRFYCSSEDHAKEIVENIIDDMYEIEVGFYFAGFKQVTTNLVSITSDQLKSVLSKTIADGGNKNAQYMHRNQGSTFVSKYVTNVKKMIYMENLNANVSSLSAGLEDQFISLLQQGMTFSDEAKLDAKLYDQVWSPSDLNTDRITSEIKKMFTYNQTETERHNFSDNFFDFNQAYAQSSSSSGSGSVSIFGLGSASGGGGSSSSSSGHLLTTAQSIFSQTEIQNFLTQESIETAWSGEKFIPKSFSVYKLTDITDRLQVAIIAKQLIAEKANGAIVRTVNTRSSASLPSARSFIITGEIKMYSGNASSLPESWVFCHGQALPRIEYQRLFSVIGETFGVGDGKTTFNVPDFRGRFPLGLNPLNNQSAGVNYGGSSTQTLTVDQIPVHRHNRGTLTTMNTGSHAHPINDTGHNHGGSTDTRPGGGGGYNLKVNGGGNFNDQTSHVHTIPTGRTGISILTGGIHNHTINGLTDYVGGGKSFSIMPPYQTVDFIIYTGD